MAVNGRINVDVLFHDTDGTTSLKVVSLEDSQEYTSGKVAIVTGTCGTAAVIVDVTDLPYRDASGTLVGFQNPFPIRFAFSATGSNLVECRGGQTFASSRAVLLSKNNSVSVSDTDGDTMEIEVLGTAGTASYTLVLYGT